MTELLANILWYIILLNGLVLSVLVLFMVNARINLKRKVDNLRFFHKVVEVSKISGSSYEAAESLSMELERYKDYCHQKGIDIPETRIEKQERLERERQDQEKRILEEEARWRAEQERIQEEQRKAIEAEKQERKNTIRRGGFR